MIEWPESVSLAKQLNDTVKGKVVERVVANASPHKFAWFQGDPQGYHEQLAGKTVGEARGIGGKLEIAVGERKLGLAEGINVRYYAKGEALPQKHQLLLAFTDGSALVCTVQMYGGMWLFAVDDPDFAFYAAAKQKPSPLSDGFTFEYFMAMAHENAKKSAKALLATEQRIPGLGNGVLQDILFNARVNPKTKVSALTDAELRGLYDSVIRTLRQMAEQGGRDTETDLRGNPGGYRTLMSKNTVGKPCPVCGSAVVKAAYMGGSVYYCPTCQPERK